MKDTLTESWEIIILKLCEWKVYYRLYMANVNNANEFDLFYV